ncbi:MAG: UDP-N-acetylmuramate dehydrogenase [Bacteroidota bacterium]
MIERMVDLKPYNTFGISANASEFTRFNSTAELRSILNVNKGKDLLILGGGSNLLLTKDVDQLVLRNEIKGIELVKEDTENYYVKAGAGEVWHEFVMHCVDNNYGGVENLSFIPGSVGASPMQNIGAYGVEIKDVFHELEAMHIATGELHHFDVASCEFGYRESVFKRKFKNQYVICSVTFRLSKNHRINSTYGAINSELEKLGITDPTIKDISNAVIAIRSSKLPNPAEIGNAGSFFKNPVVEMEVLEKIIVSYPDAPFFPTTEHRKVKLAAGWLIEKAGWKGFSEGNYGVHKLQALVLVNYGGSTGQQIYDLSSRIIADIEDKFGVTLEREVNIL